MTFFVLFFPASGYLWTPRHCKKGMTQSDKKGGYGECTHVPVFIPGNLRARFSFRGNVRMYPRSGFRSGGTSTKTTLLENHLFGISRQMGCQAFFPFFGPFFPMYGVTPISMFFLAEFVPGLQDCKSRLPEVAVMGGKEAGP